MDRLWYLLDLSLALPLLLNGFDAFIAALGVCVLLAFLCAVTRESLFPIQISRRLLPLDPLFCLAYSGLC
jgi:hypothetical protein